MLDKKPNEDARTRAREYRKRYYHEHPEKVKQWRINAAKRLLEKVNNEVKTHE